MSRQHSDSTSIDQDNDGTATHGGSLVDDPQRYIDDLFYRCTITQNMMELGLAYQWKHPLLTATLDHIDLLEMEMRL